MNETFIAFYRIARAEHKLPANAAYTMAFCAVRLRRMTFEELGKWLSLTGGYLRSARPNQLAGLRAIFAEIEPNATMSEVLLPSWAAVNR